MTGELPEIRQQELLLTGAEGESEAREAWPDLIGAGSGHRFWGLGTGCVVLTSSRSETCRALLVFWLRGVTGSRLDKKKGACTFADLVGPV